MQPSRKAQFQSFEETADPRHGAARVAALRSELARRGLDGFVVPRTDEYQSEYVPPSSERLAWLTGFTGSWGAAVVLRDKAAIFVDGRYTVQVREQVDAGVFTPEHLIENPPEAWLETHLKAGQRLGYDPALHTPDAVKKLEKAVGRVGATLVPVDGNPIDAVWEDRPAPPCAQVVLHPSELAGEESAAKLVAHPGRSSRRSATRRSSDQRSATPSPGPSTSGAATSRTRRCPWALRWCRRRGGRRCSWTHASSPMSSGTRWQGSPTLRSPPRSTAP